MRSLSWAIFSVYTTSASSIRRFPFFSHYNPDTCEPCYEWACRMLHSKQRRELSSRPTKRLHTMESKRDCTEESTNEVSIQGNMVQMSPYERKIGKSISLCSKCVGEGKIRGPLSKKARAQAKSHQFNSTDDTGATNKASAKFGPSMKLCVLCDGSGLVANSLSPMPMENTDKETNLNEVVPQHSPLSVAIIGGGIGGIALAAALQHRNIDCVVYERDISFEERKQGYGLTMQQGARALRSLGFISLTDCDGEVDSNDSIDNSTNYDGIPRSKFGIHSKRHVVHLPDGTVVGEWGMQVWGGRFEKNGRKHAKRQNAHISRQNLRKLLMDMLKPGTIRWGYKLVDYTERRIDCDDANTDNLNLNLTFHCRRHDGSEGAEEECDDNLITASASVLVGCDGIRSSVRPKKLGEDAAPLRYLGCIVILGIGRSPDSQLTNGETVFQTADGVTRLYAMPFAQPGEHESSDHGLSMWQLSFPMEECDAKDLSALGPTALKSEALKRCGQWHDPIPALLLQTQNELITGYPCYDRALVEKHAFRDGCNSSAVDSFVTMLGDAAHPMSPFKGQGANQALLDAILLSRKLYKSICVDRKAPRDECISDRIPTSLAEFEEEMLQRAAVKVEKSASAAKFLHSDVAISKGNVTRGAAAADDVVRKEQL